MTEIEVNYTGELRCEAIHKPSGAVITTDAPVDNHGKGEAFSPTDLAAAALGTCMATIMAIAAERHKIDCRGTRVVVRKEMSSNPPRRIVKLSVDFYIPLPANHPQRSLLENAAISCPIHYSLHPDIEQKLQFYWQE